MNGRLGSIEMRARRACGKSSGVAVFGWILGLRCSRLFADDHRESLDTGRRGAGASLRDVASPCHTCGAYFAQSALQRFRFNLRPYSAPERLAGREGRTPTSARSDSPSS